MRARLLALAACMLALGGCWSRELVHPATGDRITCTDGGTGSFYGGVVYAECVRRAEARGYR